MESLYTLFLYLFALALFGPLFFWMATFVYTNYRGSPYVPIKPERYRNILKFIKKGDRVADLGCGDGRMLAEAIKLGAARADGWELDALVFTLAQKRLSKLGAKPRAKIKVHFGDFWRAKVADFNVIYVYQMTKYLGPFKETILPQLKTGTLILSPDYQIPGMKYWKKDKGIFVYRV